jgi:hypothetical protein
VQASELVDHLHDVRFDDIPAISEKGASKTIRTRGLVSRHLVDGVAHLLLRERVPEAVEIRVNEG